jgi:hypothetical protein
MVPAAMSWTSGSHEIGYQHDIGKHAKVLNLANTDFLWQQQLLQPNLVRASGSVPGLYNEGGRPTGHSVKKSLDSSFRFDKEDDVFWRLPEPMHFLNLANRKEGVEKTFGEPTSASQLEQRMPLPVAQPEPNDNQIRPPLSPDNHLTTTLVPARQSSTMGIPKVSSQLPVTRPGPGPGPGPGPLNTVPERKRLDLRRFARQTQDVPLLNADWQKIKNLRVATWTLRGRIHELRKLLREKQYEKSIADDRYFQHVRMRGLGVTLENQDISRQQKSISQLLDDCQRVRDEYGPLEDDCNLLEDKLGRDEYELTKLETRFHERQSDPEALQEELHSPVSDSSVATSYSGSDLGRDSHPLVSQYLSQLGDVDILKERLDYQIEEKFSLEYEKNTRLRVGLELAKDDQEWLDNYDSLEGGLLEEIKEAVAEAERLKHLCIRQGLLDEDGNPTDFEKRERQTFLDEAPEVDAGAERSEFVKFPVLLPRPGSKEVQFFNTGPKASELSDSAGDHINQWLLHQLRSSPLDVSLLARTFEDDFGHIKGEKWQFDVLAFWYKDGARKGSSHYRVYSSGVATQAPQRAGNSAKSYSDAGGRLSFGIVISSSLSPAESESNAESLDSIESTKGFRTYLPPPPIPGPKLSRSI